MAKKAPERGGDDKTVVPSDTLGSDLDSYAAAITAAWYKTIEGIIEAGQLLNRAKAELGHGNFQTLFQDRKVPFGERTAQRLMAIAEHPILTNPTHASALPRSWTTLYALTALPERELEVMLVEGRINSETGRPEVEEIASKIRDTELQAAVIESLSKLAKAIERWPDAAELAPNLSVHDLGDLAKLSAWITSLQLAFPPP